MELWTREHIVNHTHIEAIINSQHIYSSTQNEEDRHVRLV